ncbi:MAG TPA: L-threonylcarbamoyladenylate synthase [Acidobacteriota bacterium]|nr:L-threonylcarbamoyladenylate synthase [Acidobacteriota bacterium]
MATELVAVNPASPDEAVIERAAGLLSEGGLLVVPTETRYGLLTRFDRPESLVRLYRVKRRPTTVPTALFLTGYEEFSQYGKRSSITDRLAVAFLPGPLTLVVEATTDPGEPVVVAGKIGLRVSSSRIVASLLQSVGVPLTATSANISGQTGSETATDIAAALGPEVDLYLDAGRLAGPVSTVVDCSGGHARILREGAISAPMIERALDRQD